MDILCAISLSIEERTSFLMSYIVLIMLYGSESCAVSKLNIISKRGALQKIFENTVDI